MRDCEKHLQRLRYVISGVAVTMSGVFIGSWSLVKETRRVISTNGK